MHVPRQNVSAHVTMRLDVSSVGLIAKQESDFNIAPTHRYVIEVPPESARNGRSNTATKVARGRDLSRLGPKRKAPG